MGQIMSIRNLPERDVFVKHDAPAATKPKTAILVWTEGLGQCHNAINIGVIWKRFINSVRTIVSHGSYATGAACQQRTLTPPDTWSCPTLGLACVLMLRPIFSELVLSPDLWISNTPRYFSFPSKSTDSKQICPLVCHTCWLGFCWHHNT